LRKQHRFVIEEEIGAQGTEERFHIWKNANFRDYQRKIFERQLTLERAHNVSTDLLFMDRSGVDCIAYLKRRGETPDIEMEVYARESQLWEVFVLDTLPNFDPRLGTGRMSTEEESKEMRQQLVNTYGEQNIPVVEVPAWSVNERAEFVLETLDKQGDRSVR
jgi:predicted ATPase